VFWQIQSLEATIAEQQNEIARLQTENNRLRMQVGSKDGLPQSQQSFEPSGELTIHTMASYIQWTLADDPQIHTLLPKNTPISDAISDGVLLWYAPSIPSSLTDSQLPPQQTDQQSTAWNDRRACVEYPSKDS
jgi:hypothetical protein